MARGKKRSKKQQNVSTEAERKGLGPKNQHVKSPIKMHDKPAGSAVTGSKADEAKQLNLSSGLSSACSSPAFNGFDSAKVNRKRSVDISDEVSHPSSDQCDTDSDREVTHCSTYINGIYNSKPLCDYCSLTFKSESELSVHCQSEAHQIVVMSDSGREWEHRPPPRGLLAEGYTLCENWDKTCKYGTQCVEAHSAEELQEWCERFEYRQNKIQQAEQQNLLGKSYTEQLLEKWTSNPDNVLKEKVDYAEDCVSENQLTTTVSKDSKTDWTFLVKTSRVLKAVVLLQFPDRHRFSIKCVKRVVGGESVEWSQQDCQEWISPEINKNSPDNLQVHKSNLEFKYSVCVEFFSDIYGTFRQTVAFDFGVEPLLVKHLCVDVRPASFASNVDELKKELFMEERWDENNAEIMKFSTSDEAYSAYSSNGLEELLRLYPTPTPSTFTLTQSTVTERTITKNNYPSRMHELLGVEEMARYQQVARYNVRAKLNVTKSYLLAPAGTTHSTAKYAQNDQLYAVMNLTQAISEDTAAGRLILSNCTSVLLCAAGKSSKLSKEDSDTTEPVKRKVFEALIEDKGKNVIYLKLSSEAVKEYNIVGGRVFHAEVQFQLNRLPYCEWHHAVDSIQDYKMLFPETFLEPNIPWSPQRQWKEITETKLNVKQKEAIVAITTPLNIQLPPVLIIGPFGTGKTYTLAQAIKQLLSVPDSRIIVCTHSNSAADIYIIDYLHPYVLGGHEAARPLRIYYHKRWVTTVHPTVQKYCLIKTGIDGTRRFQLPTAEDIMKHRVIVVTLNMSMVLSTLGLKKGCFTHIFLDEAAQAMECEAIMPLAVAGERTRIVLAGDHMQLNPELFSPFAKERNLHISLLERLYDHYPTTFPCKILLTENYRAHEAIIKFTSDLFYDQKLVCSGRQPGHPKFYPLTFFACRGEDVQETNSTSHYNLAEVYEIAERVIELRKCWPSEWGDLNDQSIGIMTPYADQVFRIRCELRRRNLGAVSVESVLNVQGKQFRAIFISTVRTRKTCNSGAKSSGNEESEYGFLSNSKLLNTAITRAQSLVAVVGDPIALCSLGRCRKVWESYIKSCDERNSLFGMPWSTIQAHLDGVEFKTSYVLNPLAPEFIPRAKSNLYNNSGNDALVLNGYHSHLAYFDQSSPGQTQPTYPYPQQWNGPGHRPGSGTMPASASKPLPALGPVPAPGPGIGSAHQSSHVEGQFHPNMYRPSHVHNTPPPQQQPYGAYHAHHAPAQKWGVPPDSHYRSSVQQAYLVGTCRFQPTPEVVQPTASLHAPHVPVHIIPQPPTLWPGTGHQANSGAHIAPPGLAVPPGLPAPPGLAVPPGLAAPPGLTAPPGLAAPANLNSKGFESAPVESKLIIQGGVDIPSNELLGNSIRSSKINGIVLDSGAQAFNASNTVQHIEPYSAQIAQSMQPPTHQIVPQSVNPAFFSNRQSPYQLQFAQQQALLQQLTQHSQPPGTQRPILQQQPVLSQQVIANGPFLAIVPNPQINPVPINSPQMQQQQKQLQLQQQQQQQHHHQQQLQQLQQLQQQRQQMNHQLLQQPEQQLQNQLMQLQPMSESFGHEQRLREVENQLRLQQEQHRQQQLQLAILQERRKLLLGHILTPLVNCKPEWNKLIPRGVNLLDMVDNKSQQEEWFNHLIRHGQGELAKMFAEFMVLCVRAITATSSDQRQPSTSPPLNKILSSNPNVTMTANAVESVTATSLLSSPNNHQEPSSTVLASDDEKPTIETSKQTDEPVIMMKDLDPKYMLGSDALLNGGKSVWAIAQDELERCSRNGARSKAGNASQQKSFQKTNTFDSDDSGDELLSSINRQLNLQQSVDE